MDTRRKGRQSYRYTLMPRQTHQVFTSRQGKTGLRGVTDLLPLFFVPKIGVQYGEPALARPRYARAPQFWHRMGYRSVSTLNRALQDGAARRVLLYVEDTQHEQDQATLIMRHDIGLARLPSTQAMTSRERSGSEGSNDEGLQGFGARHCSQGESRAVLSTLPRARASAMRCSLAGRG